MKLADNTYRVVLFGHRDFDGHRILEKKLYPMLKDLILRKSFLEIYIGRNGEFDIYAATVVKRVQNLMGKENNELICVLPYPEKNIECYQKYYDSVVIPECIGKTHPKGAITKRNKWMIKQADLCIFYVEQEKGGAYTALKYANKLKKQTINFAKRDKNENEQ